MLKNNSSTLLSESNTSPKLGWYPSTQIRLSYGNVQQKTYNVADEVKIRVGMIRG